MQSKRRKAPTREERLRMQRIPNVGCVACWLQWNRRALAQVHHIVESGRRIRSGELGTEHRYTLGLCPWHHQSEAPDAYEYKSPDDVAAIMGPPFGGEHASKRAFEQRYGTQRELLKLQDELLECPPNEEYLVVERYRRARLDEATA